VLLDPGHGSGADEDDRGKASFLPFWRERTDDAGFGDWLVVRSEIVEQVGAGGKRGALPEDQVAPIFDSLVRDLASRFAIDPERLYVRGLSQTGFWAWVLAAARPDRWAGIAPMSAVTWQADPLLENYLTLPVFVLHGERDPICKVEQPRATTQRLAGIGVRVEYREIAGAAHDFATWKHLGEGLRWLVENPRPRYPARVVKCLQTLETPWCHWLRVDSIEKKGSGEAGKPPTARIEARLVGQTVEISSTGVRQATVWLAREMLDLAAPVRVRWNGETVHEGTVQPSFELAVETALKRSDWLAVYEARLELRAPR
jgi:dienelactone hydrolase